ncbi:uncharacterized protein LOC121739172 [Aricia agestis]|uniref:uncharacterized protein LOC121739172 n=1 Tax=Aricia agestis TaxID=91739 RepID=UPI001C20C1FA|nr:uncharacterized protein LOC121739172 [Aricia agestis]
MATSEKSPSAMLSQSEGGSIEDEEKDPQEELPSCIKLQLNDHIKAYIKRNTLLRDHVESIDCNQNIVDKVILNYIIAKQILSNLDWQDKMLCNNVCTTWHSAVQSLIKENTRPEDFVIDFHPRSLSCKTHFRKSGNFNKEPLVVINFANISAYTMTHQCKNIEPRTCQPSCKRAHSFLDVIYKYTSAPKDCMITIKSDYLSYMPLPQSVTSRHTITHLKSAPFIGGLYIPSIPDVEFHRINIKSYNNMKEDFFDVVERLSTTRIFKGIVVFVTDKYLLHTVEDIILLNHFKKVQPDIPYALGGCIVDDTIFDHNDIQGVVDSINENKHYISENLISIAAFTVPKDKGNAESNFDMFSLILDSSEWSKAKIEHSISEFSKQVPRFEHSAALKLSCVGRDQKHKFEQDCFRSAFPDTPIVGCYGNGEIGANNPIKPELPCTSPSLAKKKREAGPQFGIMYSYSTVFMYMGWGRIISPMGPVTK